MAAASFDADVLRHGGAAGRTGPLGVHAASRKIGKPAGAGGGHGQQERKPVIIYMVSPKVIHVEAHEFMPLVQRLTGPDAGGRGDKKAGRASTSGGADGSSSPRQEQEGERNKGRAAPPVRVKARALNRPAGPAVSVSVTATATATRQQAGGAAAPSAAVSASPSSGFMFHDLSPLRGAALKGEHLPLVSPGWLAAPRRRPFPEPRRRRRRARVAVRRLPRHLRAAVHVAPAVIGSDRINR